MNNSNFPKKPNKGGSPASDIKQKNIENNKKVFKVNFLKFDKWETLVNLKKKKTKKIIDNNKT